MKKEFLCISVLFFCSFIFAQPSDPDSHYKLVSGKIFLQSKNYYLLTLLEEDKAVRSLMEKDEVLSSLAKGKKAGLDSALNQCSGTVSCITERLKFSDTEIKSIGDRLAYLYKGDNALGLLVSRHLIPSGNYILYTGSPKDRLVKAWEQDARGINFTIGVYTEGAKAHYPLIDSISFNVADKRYSEFIHSAVYTAAKENSNQPLFFDLPLVTALLFLQANERINAADYEPMAAGVNKAAADKVKSIRWADYPYTLILVPGAGPEEPTVALSAEGMLRCRLAAIQYRKESAPFIMVSGGKVHPYKTKYCEAEEMKRFLIEDLKIPEEAVIMEPHARHTTTNMRNCVRLIYRYGMPMEKPCLVTTTRGQSNAIATTLVQRCKTELGEIPYRVGRRLSETDVEFYPVIDALHITPEEPMDP